jgi:hypothetical protein
MAPTSELGTMDITWDAYLGEYLGFPRSDSSAPMNQRRIYATRDLATEQWTYVGLVGNADNAWYRWVIDPVSLDESAVVGKTFRSYCAVDCSTYDAEYTNITLQPSSSTQLPTSPVATGVDYQINAGDGLVLAQSGSGLTTAPAKRYAAGESASRSWSFVPTGDGFYTVVNTNSGEELGVNSTSDVGRAWGASVTLAADTEPNGGQDWYIQAITSTSKAGGPSMPTGSYRLVNRYSGLALNLGSGPVQTVPQRSWTDAGSGGDATAVGAQTLTFEAVGGSAGVKVRVSVK